MKEGFYKKRIGQTIAALLVGAMLFLLCACAEQQTPADEAGADGTEMVTVEREAGPEALQAANAATALALRYYIYARLKTEEFASADFENMSLDEISAMTEETAKTWETADTLAAGAVNVTGRAVEVLEGSGAEGMAAEGQPRYTALSVAAAGGMRAKPVAASGDVEPKAWAENLTKQYDALRGAQRYGQLAQQLGTDTKTAVEQMALAQEIIRNQAVADADFWDKMTKAAMATQTACKVGLYVGATVATGGGSLASLAASNMTLGTAGAVLVGGVSCIADVGTTTSTIVLGENNQVTLGFQKAGDVLQPASMVLGLVTLNPNEAEGLIALVGEYTMEWFNPGKITGIGINKMKEGGAKIIAQAIDTADKDVPGIRESLEAAGLSLPSEKGVSAAELAVEYTVNSEAALASMKALEEEIGMQEWEGESPELQTQEVAPAREEETPGGEQAEEAGSGAVTSQEMAGTYSGSAALKHIEEDIEGPDSLPVTLQLGENGTGTVDVNGYGGEAEYAGNAVHFSVLMEDDEVSMTCVFDGKASKNGGRTVISGEMRFFMMGVAFATYSWTA